MESQDQAHQKVESGTPLAKQLHHLQQSWMAHQIKSIKKWKVEQHLPSNSIIMTIPWH